MTLIRSALLALLLAAPASSFAAEPADMAATAARLRDAALASGVAYGFVTDMTTQVPVRQGGTEGEHRARDWLLARLTAMGFSNVRAEPFTIQAPETSAVRGVELAEIVGPVPQRLAIVTLGRSGSTPARGITAPLVRFDSLDALRAAPAGSLAGRIVYLSHRMVRTTDGASYGANGGVRRTGPAIAAAKGAAAILIRSLGTDDDARNPHSGSNAWDAGQTPIPAAAMSLPDSAQLDRLFALGGPVTLRLVLTPTTPKSATSANVLAEIPGTDPVLAKEIVLIGGHYDAWDQATGAQDDAAGVAITVAAAKAILDCGLKPRRTIRLVLFGSEEQGIFGGRAYAAAHATEPHAMAAESDFGSGKVYALASRVRADALPAVAAMAAVLAPLGVSPSRDNANTGGPDLVGLAAAGVPILSPEQDGYRYFDVHHTPADTLDRIAPADMAQNSAVYAAIVWMAANGDTPLGPVKP